MASVLPEPDYQRFLSEGRFMLQRSRNSDRFVFYPRVAEPVTGALDLEWVEASGRGQVYSVTVISQRPPTPNYNVAVIELEEGVHVLSRVESIAPEEVRIGMAVKARISFEDEQPLLVFDPA